MMLRIATAISVLCVFLVVKLRFLKQGAGDEHEEVSSRQMMQIMLSMASLRVVVVAAQTMLKPGTKGSRHVLHISAALAAATWLARLWRDCVVAWTGSKSSTLQAVLSAGLAYRVMEGFFSLSVQVPLLEASIVPSWAILAVGLADAFLISNVAKQIMNTAFFSHLPVSLITRAFVPFLVYNMAKQRRRPAISPATCSCPPQADAVKVSSSLDDNKPCCGRNCESAYMGFPSDDSNVKPHSHGRKQQREDACEIEERDGFQHYKQRLSTVEPLDAKSCSILGKAERAYKSAGPYRACGAHGVTLQYKSNLVSKSRVVCMKVRTSASIEELPPDLASQLQASLQDICGTGYRISQLAFRQGCVLIRSELLNLDAGATEAGTSNRSTVKPGAHTVLLDLAHAVLPCLKPLIPLGFDKACTANVDVRIQQNDDVVLCSWDDHQNTWVLKQQHAIKQGNKHSPHLGLVRASGNDDSVDSTTSVPIVANRGPRDTKPYCESEKASDMQLLLEVQVFDLAGVNASMHITGWKPLPPGKHEEQVSKVMGRQTSPEDPSCSDDSPVSYNLLACWDGLYCKTDVVNIKSEAAHPNCTSVMVRVTLPQASIAHAMHHATHKVSGIWFVSLELWSDELLLSTSHAQVVQTAIVSRPANKSPSTPLPCWWWGSRPATVTVAMAELAKWTGETWSLEGANSNSSYRDLIHDLRVWMTGIRDMMQAHKLCMSKGGRAVSLPAAQLPYPALDPQQLHEVGKDLSAYAHIAGLHAVSDMINEQLAMLQRNRARLADESSRKSSSNSTPTAVRHAASSLWVSICGYPCSECESLYRERLSHHLASTQAVYAVVILVSVAMFMRNSILSGAVSDLIMLACWLLPHSVVCFHHYKHFGSYAKQHPTTCSRVSACSFLAVAVVWLAVAAGLLTPSVHVLKVYQSHVGPLILLTLSLGEQLQASIILPAPMVAVVATTLAVTMPAQGACTSPFWAGLALNLLITVLVRLLADMHLRQLLMS